MKMGKADDNYDSDDSQILEKYKKKQQFLKWEAQKIEFESKLTIDV